MTRLLLARHGLADYESDLMTDDGGSLSTEGRAQARALGIAARDAGVTDVWCSPLSRAVQTAEIAAAVADVEHVTVREGLREYGVGDHAGRPEEDEGPLLRPVFDAWVGGDDEAAIPGGERIRGIADRVTRVLEEAAAAGGTALVVSHGGAIMTTVPHLVGAPRATALEHVLDGGGHLVLDRSPSGWQVSLP